jgi:predicted peptidase
VITVTFDDLSYSDEIAISYKNDGDSLEITNDNIDFDYCEADEFLYGKNDTLSYRYYVPDDTDDELPLVLVLHGAGITGDDNELQLLSSDNATHFASDSLQSDYPCYVLAPQLPNDYVATDESPTDEQSALGWTDPAVQKAIIQTINELAEKYSIDMDRIYITGHSMGGLGVWGFITSYPDYFAAAAPISGLWNDDVSMLTDLPIWVFHGQNDPLVPIANEQDSVEKIEALGNPNIKWTVYSDDDLPDMGEYSAHMANIPTYNRADFNEWLFSHVKISD